jgi:hypothetical protein
MRRPLRLAALAAALAAGMAAAALLAGTGLAQDVTTTETTTTVETTTAPAETVLQTETVERTTTRILTRQPPTTTSSQESTSSTPTWVWVLLGALAIGLIAALIALFTGRRGSHGIPLEQRQRQLRNAVGSWVAQGWAVESETGDSAVLVRGAERMLITVDAAGQVASRSLQ